MKDMKPIAVSGTVARFNGKGRQLGYPTANLATETDARDGVYFGFADLAGFTNHPSLIFVGIPTTLGDKERRVEAYLLDIPDKDYYDQPLSLTLEHYHRPNKTFPSIDELLAVIKADETAARRWFRRQAP
jgi:riboflavin kinase/FMN adenylyltransferase